MWSKISNVLKPLTSSREESDSNNGGSVMNKVLEQHPNLSVFHHSNDSGPLGRHSVDGPSPSVHSKKNMFKRLSKPLLNRDDAEEMRPLPPSPVVTQVHGPTHSRDFNCEVHSLFFYFEISDLTSFTRSFPKLNVIDRGETQGPTSKTTTLVVRYAPPVSATHPFYGHYTIRKGHTSAPVA
jgi:hypothetical protein